MKDSEKARKERRAYWARVMSPPSDPIQEERLLRSRGGFVEKDRSLTLTQKSSIIVWWQNVGSPEQGPEYETYMREVRYTYKVSRADIEDTLRPVRKTSVVVKPNISKHKRQEVSRTKGQVNLPKTQLTPEEKAAIMQQLQGVSQETIDKVRKEFSEKTVKFGIFLQHAAYDHGISRNAVRAILVNM
jgi:hypothetical protein